MIICRARSRVERVLRGDPVDPIDLSDRVSDYRLEDGGFPVSGGKSGMFPAEVGRRYLVLATHTNLGELERRLAEAALSSNQAPALLGGPKRSRP
jgi:hypothetical protein